MVIARNRSKREISWEDDQESDDFIQEDEDSRDFHENEDFDEDPDGLDEIEFSEDELTAELCRKDFFEFVKEFWNTVIEEEPVWNWHIEWLCRKFQRIAERVFRGEPVLADTTVNIPPGTTKTTILCVMLPAWIWTRMPHARIASISYAHDQAALASLLARDLIQSDKYRRLFPEIKLRDDTNAKAHYANTSKGYRFACGVDGQILGKHFHFIVVDDPIDPNQVASDAELKAVNRFMERVLPGRKVNKKVTPIILVMQRLHENDPAGVRLERAAAGAPHDWVCFPAYLTDDVNPPECRDYYIDGLLDPIRLDGEVLDRVQKEQGDYVLAGQYLQRPIPEGMALFHVDKIKVVDRIPDDIKIVKWVRFWDKAGTEGAGKFTVGLLIGIDQYDHVWIVDVIRDRLDSSRRESLIKRTAHKDGKGVWVGVEQEPGSGGKHSAQVTVKNLLGYRVTPVAVGKADGDKVARAYGLSTQVNNGNVTLIKAVWNLAFVNELRYFPFSKYKDQVDAASGGFNLASGKRRLLGGARVLPSRAAKR